jgi:hypothetical protein
MFLLLLTAGGCPRLRRQQASGRRDQGPSPRPIRGMCFEACANRQSCARLVRTVWAICSEIAKKWRMLASHDLHTRSVGLLRSLLRALNGTKMRVQVLQGVLTRPSTWWLMVCPEKQGPALEKCSFVDFGGGDWCRRPWSGIAGNKNLQVQAVRVYYSSFCGNFNCKNMYVQNPILGIQDKNRGRRCPGLFTRLVTCSCRI